MTWTCQLFEVIRKSFAVQRIKIVTGVSDNATNENTLQYDGRYRFQFQHVVIFGGTTRI